MNQQQYLIVIGGPTASGKTRFAIELAKHYRAPILSADSRQFYREMVIGTARPTKEELAEATHYFVGHLSIQDPYDVGTYEEDAMKVLNKVFQDTQVAILVGGSGLYIKAVCEGLNEFPEVPASIKEEIEQAYQEQGLAYLQAEVSAADPKYYDQVDRNNPHRLMRALAVCRASGKPFSGFREQEQADRFFTPVFLQLQWPRQQLYERINQRVDQMIAAGLESEARSLYPFKNHTALQTVGYQELFDYFDEKTTKTEAIDLIKRNSRRYAKRQLTWYRRDGYWKLFRPEELELAVQYIEATKDRGLAIQYQTIEAPPHPIHADRYLNLEVKQTDGPSTGVYLYIRKKESLAVIEEIAASPDRAVFWLLHELSLSQWDQRLYIFSALTLPDVPAGFRLKTIALKDIPSWMINSWDYLNSEGKDYNVYELGTP